jgi:competence protein ComEC
VVDRAPGWQDRVFALGETLRSQLRRALGPEDSALLEGMLLGGSRGIPAERLRLFTRCGLSHLLSVSGSHVALLLGLFAGGAAFLPLPRKMSALLVAFLLVSYGILCGLRASVCRALLLGLGALWGRVHRKRASSTAFLGLGLLLLPAWHPWWVWDPGFQLSFAAAGGLLLLRRPVEEKLAVWLPLPLARGLSVPLGAQILGLPFLIYHFHMLSLVSLLANVLLVPLLSLCLAFGASGAMLSALGLSFPGGCCWWGQGSCWGFRFGVESGSAICLEPTGFRARCPCGVAPVPAPGAGAAGTGLVQTGAAPAAAGRNHGIRAGTVSFAACPPFPAPDFLGLFPGRGTGGLCCGGHP